jgi:UDP-2,3-diacylglucosamine hydrolase
MALSDSPAELVLPLPVWFVSDVHWPLTRTYVQGQPFLSFLESLEGKGGSLILLGDIFDFWFEWREVVPAYWFDLFYRLRRLIDRGTRILFVNGNHDFHPGSYLEKEIGLELSPDELVFRAGEKRFHACHGDGLARRDRGYRLLKKVIRHPASIWLYKTLLHPDWGIALARWTSHTSRKHRQIDKAAWAEEYFDFARTGFERGADYVVLGHLHYPELRQAGEKAYLNCGDWLSDHTYGFYDGRTLQLRHWPD